MDSLARIAEARLAEALARGALDNPLAGKPLAIDRSADVPEELRFAYKVLSDAGYLPEELELKKEMLRLDQLLAVCESDDRRAALQKQRLSKELRFALLLEKSGCAGLVRAWLDARRGAARAAGDDAS